MTKFFNKKQTRTIRLLVCVLVSQFFLIQSVFAQTLVTSVEAETGTRAGGLTIATANAGYSGTGYVTNMANTGDNLTIPVTVPTAGIYQLVIRYNGPYGAKDQDVYVNGTFVSSLHFAATTGYTDLTAGSLLLNAGANTIAIYKSWGYTDFDKITLYTVPPHDYSTVVPAPIDPAATPEAIALYNYLKAGYGTRIISGQTDDYYPTVSPNAAKKPVIRAYDFNHYTVGYPYAWDNATASHTFGWQDDGTTQAAIDWYNSTCQKGMVAFHWHWCSPFGGKAGTNTFSTSLTNFDVTKAVSAGTAENTAILRDIDSIATQLKKLQAAGVPVLWRPLHEAGGAWFWWGAKGPAATLALYDILYNRLVNYHNIHNLIWQWSTPEPNWYPGNAKVDMIGYDSYPGAYNYGTQKLLFDQLFTIVNGQKMVALTENGPIPDPDLCFVSDAKWAYFMSWSDLVTQQNSAAQLNLVYNHAKVVTLDEVATPTSTAKITAAGPVAFCAGGSVLLKANAAKGFTYKWYNGANVINGATSSSYTAIAAGSYTVAVTATGTCTTTSAPVVVTVGGPTVAITAATATTFCQGGSVVLNATTGSGFTYLWYKDANLISGATSAAYTANATGLYSVKVTASTCSATSAGTQVTVNALPTVPTITVSGVSTFCVGFKTQLNVISDAGSTLVWLVNGTPDANQTPVITKGGSYSVTSTKNGCSSTSVPTVITVTNLPVPTITASGPTTFCQGGSVDLTASTGTSYQWYDGTTILSGATNAKYTATSTGNYNAKVFNPSGCDAVSASTAVTVTATATATITAGGPTAICQGGTVVLTASTGTSYKWMLGGNAISGGTNATYTAGAAGSYTVEVANGTNCKALSAAATVTVNALPVATITAGGLTTFCDGGNVVLTASTGTAYKWMLNGNTISGGTNANYTANSTGSYTVEITNASNCKKLSAATSVTVNALPLATVTAGGPTTFCQGGNVVLTASSGTSYKWMLGGNAISGGTNASYTANATGSYTVEITNASNCKALSAATSVTVNALPTATITAGGPTTFCQGGNVVLTASSGTAYKWMLGGNVISGGTNASYTANATGLYTVEITNASNCKALSAAAAVTVNALPLATITAGGPTTFCQGGSVALTSTIGSAYPWGSSYKWMLNGTAIGGATNADYTANATGSYTVEVTNVSNCKAVSLATSVTVNALPTATISVSASTAFCQAYLLTASAGTSYKWMLGGNTISGATNSTFIGTGGNSYTVEVSNAAGCKAISAVTPLPVSLIAPVTITPNGVAAFCQGGSVLLTASTGIAYKWMLGGNAISGATNATYVAVTAGSYTVEVTNASNCKGVSAATTVTVTSAPIPTITTAESSTICPGWSVTMGASEGISYQWMLNGNAISGQTNAAYTAVSAGYYTVEVLSGPNCKATSEALEVTMANTIIWYLDKDLDGYGDAASTTQSCKQPFGYAAVAGDECPDNVNKKVPGNCGCDKTETECLDCMGVPNGGAALDVCNVCAGGTSGVIPKTSLAQCITTGTQTALSAGLKVYPNPSNHTFTIQVSGGSFTASIYSVSGEKIAVTEYNTEAVIGAELPQGIYMVRIEQEGTVEWRKLIKQ